MGEDFRCRATLGTRGGGFEQQSVAARKARVEHARPGGLNDGFLRPDSILAVLWVTDEEDCSVADPVILDPRRDDLGHLNLRCYFHPEMLRRVDEMLGELRALRANPRDFVVAMITGVPFEGSDGAACQGPGDRLGACLGRPIMQYQVDPASPGTLLPACTNPSGWGHALPGRRFVEAAQLLGSQATVYSICNDDWRPAMNGILDLIRGAMDQVCFPHELALDPATFPPGLPDQPVRKACVRRPLHLVEGERNADLAPGRRHLLIQLARLGGPEFGCTIGGTLHAVVGHVRVELEGTPRDFDVLRHSRRAEGGLEAALADVAPGADHVRVDRNGDGNVLDIAGIGIRHRLSLLVGVLGPKQRDSIQRTLSEGGDACRAAAPPPQTDERRRQGAGCMM
jgi:hypothetical protein